MNHSIKELVKMQFDYCNEIKKDIIKHNGSEEVQKYTMKFAEIESPIVGGTHAEWIRISYGGIYIYIPIHFKKDSDEIRSLGKTITYQLDFLGEYGAELIDEYSEGNFLHSLECIDEEDIKETYYINWDTEEVWEDVIPPKYIPMPN